MSLLATKIAKRTGTCKFFRDFIVAVLHRACLSQSSMPMMSPAWLNLRLMSLFSSTSYP